MDHNILVKTKLQIEQTYSPIVNLFNSSWRLVILIHLVPLRACSHMACFPVFIESPVKQIWIYYSTDKCTNIRHECCNSVLTGVLYYFCSWASENQIHYNIKVEGQNIPCFAAAHKIQFSCTKVMLKNGFWLKIVPKHPLVQTFCYNVKEYDKCYLNKFGCNIF